jgi:hypothetical protein
VQLLSCPTPERRREIGGLVVKHILGGEPEGPLHQFASRVVNSLAPAEVATVLGILYCANTSLAAQVVSDLLLPCLETSERRSVLDTATVDRYLADRVGTSGTTVLTKTRATLVAMLRRFRYLHGLGTYQVRPFQGDAWLILFAMAVDAHVRRWRSRGLAYVLGGEGLRRLLPAAQSDVRHALGLGEAAGLLTVATVGPDQDVVFAGPDALARVAEELVRRGS